MTSRCHEDRIDSQGGGRAEDGADVGMVRYVLEHGDTSGALDQREGIKRLGAVECGKWPSRPFDAGDGGDLSVRSHEKSGG